MKVALIQQKIFKSFKKEMKEILHNQMKVDSLDLVIIAAKANEDEVEKKINNYEIVSLEPVIYQNVKSTLNLSSLAIHYNEDIYYYNQFKVNINPEPKKINIYAFRMGASDTHAYNGGFSVFNRDSILILQTDPFDDDVILMDFKKKEKYKSSELDRFESLEKAMIVILKNYLVMNGFKSIALGLSGGIDSALVAYICSKAVDKGQLYTYALPSKYSSDDSTNFAREQAKRLGANFEIINIEEINKSVLTSLAPIFKGREEDLTEQNIQARIRGLILMAISNKFNHLVMATSNKSEIAVGYSTLYGDTVGALEVIGDLYKGEVYRLSKYINSKHKKPIILQEIIDREPTAELRANQKDSDSLPPYDLLDAVAEEYAFLNKSEEEISKWYPIDVVKKVVRLININEYKRRQSPPILRVSKTSFSDRVVSLT